MIKLEDRGAPQFGSQNLIGLLNVIMENLGEHLCMSDLQVYNPSQRGQREVNLFSDHATFKCPAGHPTLTIIDQVERGAPNSGPHTLLLHLIGLLNVINGRWTP